MENKIISRIISLKIGAAIQIHVFFFNSKLKNSLLLSFYSFGQRYIFFQVPYHTYIIHTCQATSNISWSPLKVNGVSWNIQGNPIGMIMDIYRGIKGFIHYTHACTIEFPALTRWGLVTHMCTGELCLHWSRHGLVALLAPSHHLYQDRPFSSTSIENI